MFRNTKAFAGFSVDDIQKARDFYGSTLDIKISEEEEGTLSLNFAGGSKALIYPKPDHSPATFTVLNFPVNDIEEAVNKLTEKGIRFEQYDEPIKTDEQGIFRGGGPLIAWFKDPAGNVLSILEVKQ